MRISIRTLVVALTLSGIACEDPLGLEVHLPAFDVHSTDPLDDHCPYERYNDCLPLDGAQKQAMIDELGEAIRTDLPECVNAYVYLLNMVQQGRIYSFGDLYRYGTQVLGHEDLGMISFNRNYWSSGGQGWPTQRLGQTALHEYSHQALGGSESQAEHFETVCINN